MKAVKKVQPSAKREGFATVPNVTWKDIGLCKMAGGAQDEHLEPIRDPERFEAVGLPYRLAYCCSGLGLGKTLLAKAIANESGANFIS